MGLWYQPHDLVCWFVLWLCLYSASCPVSNPQILLCSIGLRPSTLSLWLLTVCLHSCYGKINVASFSPHGLNFSKRMFSHFLLFLNLLYGWYILNFENVSEFAAVFICYTSRNRKMGSGWCSWVHVCFICRPQSQKSHKVCRWKLVPHCSWYLLVAAGSFFGA